MMLGSWALGGRYANGRARPEDLGYMPFPSQDGGKFHSAIAGDYKNAVSVHSKNKDAARAWVDWFADKSGYAASQGGFTPLLGGPEPEILAEFTGLGVTYIELDRSKDALVKKIDKTAEIGLYQPTYRQTLIDAARGANGQSKTRTFFADLNKRWADAKIAGERPCQRHTGPGGSASGRAHPVAVPAGAADPARPCSPTCPVVSMFCYSVTDWDGLSPRQEFVGADNYIAAVRRAAELFDVFWSACTTSARPSCSSCSRCTSPPCSASGSGSRTCSRASSSSPT